MNPVGPEERSVVLHQLARFGARCRIFAPMYRQFTLTALAGMMSGKPIAGSGDPGVRDVGYRDVQATPGTTTWCMRTTAAAWS